MQENSRLNWSIRAQQEEIFAQFSDCYSTAEKLQPLETRNELEEKRKEKQGNDRARHKTQIAKKK